MISIRSFIDNLQNYGIPEFQRDFEWKKDKIEKFWDSIYRNYPLPTFFKWQVGQNSPVGLTFFTSSFRNCRPILENIEPFNDANYHYNTTAICDGQQRLTTILIGIMGYNLGSDRGGAKFLYFNPFLGYLNGNFEENQSDSYFKILSTREIDRINTPANNNEEPNIYWIKLSHLYQYIVDNENGPNRFPNRYLGNYIDEFIPNLGARTREHIFTILMQLNNQLHKQNYLYFVELNDTIHNDLEKADEFFIRINNGVSVKPDSKLFALLTRYRVNNHDLNLKNDFLEIKNQFRDHFVNEIKPNYFLRICLYIITNDVLFRVESFNRENCIRIIENWENIKDAINKTLNLIVALGLSRCINSNNSTIPIVYHIYKNSLINPEYIPSENEKREILKYFLRSEISGYFGGEHGDSKLQRLKQNQDGLNYNENRHEFNFDEIIAILPHGTSFAVSDQNINEVLEYEYGKPMCRPLLHLIYRNLNPLITFELDHIHPKSLCNSLTYLQNLQIDNNVIQDIKNTYNRIGNLQLIPRNCNRNKSDREISTWVRERFDENDILCLNNQENEQNYFRTNFIEAPEGVSYNQYLSLSNYPTFYERRRNKLRSEILNLLNQA